MKKKKAIMLGAAGGKAILKRKNRKKMYPAHHYFFQMLRDWRNGDYPRSQVKTLLLLTAAILYIVMPLDIIPDVILGLGFIDDAAVLGLIWTLIKKNCHNMKSGVCNKYKKPRSMNGAISRLLIHAVFFINRNPAFSCDKNSHRDNFAVLLKREVMADILRHGD